MSKMKKSHKNAQHKGFIKFTSQFKGCGNPGQKLGDMHSANKDFNLTI